MMTSVMYKLTQWTYGSMQSYNTSLSAHGKVLALSPIKSIKCPVTLSFCFGIEIDNDGSIFHRTIYQIGLPIADWWNQTTT